MLVFKRNDWEIEVDPRTWADIIVFLAEAGWKSTVPTHRLLQVDEITVSDTDAAALATVGEVVMEEAVKDPFSAYSTIKFDMGAFAEIITFASEGVFTVTQRH